MTNSELIFSIPYILSYLSQGTTLEKGTLVLTGTPPGIGCMREPKVVLGDGDEVRVAIENIGTLISQVSYSDADSKEVRG